MNRTVAMASLCLLPGLVVALLGCGPRRFSGGDAVLSHTVDRVVERSDSLYVIGSVIPNSCFQAWGIGIREAVALPSGQPLTVVSSGFIYMKGQHWFVRFEGAPPSTERVRLRLALGPRADILEGDFPVTRPETLWFESGMRTW